MKFWSIIAGNKLREQLGKKGYGRPVRFSGTFHILIGKYL